MINKAFCLRDLFPPLRQNLAFKSIMSKWFLKKSYISIQISFDDISFSLTSARWETREVCFIYVNSPYCELTVFEVSSVPVSGG